MADNPFKRPDESGFLDNDPFAELLRMAEAPRAAQPETDFAANENFHIDLEREMLGDFDEPDSVPVQAVVVDHWTRDLDHSVSETVADYAVANQPADDVFDDLDLSLDLELDDDEPHLPLSVADEPQDDLVAPAITFENEGVPDDFDARSHALFAAVPEIAQESEAASEFDDFDRAFDDLEDGNDGVQQSDSAPYLAPAVDFVADAPTAFVDESPAEPLEDEFELDFDFSDDAGYESAPEDTFAHDDVLQAGPADDYPTDFATDNRVDAGTTWSAADLHAEGPVEPVAALREHAAKWHEPELRRDVTSDDDILGDIENWLNAEPGQTAPDRSGFEPIIQADAHVVTSYQEPAPVASAPQPLSLEDELGALLGDDVGFSPTVIETAREPVEAQPFDEAAPNDLDFALDLDLDDAVFGQADEDDAPLAEFETVDDVSNENWDTLEAQSYDDAYDDVAEEPVAPKKNGPLAMLAALAPAAIARFGGGERSAAAKSHEPVQPATPLFGMARTDRPVAPEIETVEVDEQPTALVDDLDIPELAEPEEVTPLFSPDDLEAELDVAFGSLAPEEEAPETAYATAASSGDAVPLQGSYTDGDYGYVHEPQAAQADDDFGDVDFDYDPDTEPLDAPPPKDGMRRKYFILGGIAAVALVGGFGYFMAAGPSGDGLPAIVRADSDPVRIRPENRGGAVVPNQNSQAYQRATGATGTVGGGQEELMTSVEEPLDVRSAVAPQPADEFPMVGMEDIPMLGDSETIAMLSTVKNDERLGSAMETLEDEGISVAPRRVRTMVVRPDGTLVARDELPAPATREQLEANAALAAPQGQITGAPRIEDAQPLGAVAPPQGQVLPDDPVMPDSVGVVPSRPQARPEASAAAQAPVQVASAQPVASAPVAQSATTPAGGEWSMQIASQPSAEGAQSTYQDLARRYGTVLEGRGVNIVRAELDGMGTFYRVRIPANTRDEAVQLCTQYKAAGGSCFVSR